MDDVFGCGDDSNSGWEGLACPPLEDFAFSFDDDVNLDAILDNPSLEGEKDSRAANGIHNKANHCYGNNGKGKQLKLNLNMAEIKAFLEEETEEQVAEQKVKKRRIMDCYDCQSLQQNERSRLNHTNDVVDSKRKADFDVRLEAAGHKLHGSSKSACQPMKPKYRVRLVHTNQHGAVNTKRKADIGCRLEAESACQPRRRDDLMRLDYTNQIAVADNKMQTDYDLRYEATRQKLHVSYEQVREAKQQRKIQVIDFQKAVMEQPRCRTKATGKASLRQKLMAMGTHKSNKKFQPFVY